MGNVIVLLVLAAVVLLAVRSLIRGRRRGKGCAGCPGCGGACAGCSVDCAHRTQDEASLRKEERDGE